MAVDWLPTPADVGAILRARTVDVNGVELGTFTAETRPTDVQVLEIIDSVVSEIGSQILTVPEELQPFARRIAAIGAACLVELTFWPEQIASDQSPYDRLIEWYNKAFTRLVTAANDVNDGGEVGGDDIAMPVWGFPDGCWMVGLGTRW